VYPTADEAARIIIAAFRMTQANPLDVAARLPRGQANRHQRAITEGRGYAALAIRKLFPNLSSKSIARMIGLPDDAGFVIKSYQHWQAGTLRWYDEVDFRRILKNCGVGARAAVQIVRDETAQAPEPPRRAAPPVTPPAQGARPPEFGAKKRLEDELREAVQNTARMQQEEPRR